MRLTILFTSIFTVCLWGQAGYSDIYVWVDENDVTHFTNQNPPPHAQVLMQTKEVPYDEAADRARREAEKQQELEQAQAEVRELEQRLEAQQAEELQRLAEAEGRVEAALQRAEDLLESSRDRYDSDRRYTDSYVYYPGSYLPYRYGFPKYDYRTYGGIYYHIPKLLRRKDYRFKRHRFGTDFYFRKRFKAPGVWHRPTFKKFNTSKQYFRNHRFQGSGSFQFHSHTGGLSRIHANKRGRFGRR